MHLLRNSSVTLSVTLALLAIFTMSESNAEQKKHHALSLIGKPKYGAGFKHFDHVNPDAPKGGKVRSWAQGTFETLNPFARIKGNPAIGLGLIYESLFQDSLEEPSTGYGLIAKSVSYPEDISSVTFELNEKAKWHDGKPITVEDVIYSLKTLKAVDPRTAQYYHNVKEAKKTGPNEVTFYFDVKNNRELPTIVGQLNIIPKHYWTGKDKDGKQRDPSKSTMEPPLGSGPYKIKSVTTGRSITYERVKDYWGKDLPVNIGKNNFDQIQYTYFRDSTIAFEAFKAGKLDVFEVSSSKRWATGFSFNAMKNGKVTQKIVPKKSVKYMQAFAFNTRKSKFSDRRVRKALDYAFDFEWSNKNLFYGQYTRLNSYFDDTEMAAKGIPSGAELDILNEFKGKIPDEVFSQVYKSPENGNSKNFRSNIRKALRLLKAAGWVIKDGKLTNSKTGEKMNIEFLIVSPSFERVVLPFAANLKRLGIDCSVRTVDIPQYKRRLDSYDYDIIVSSFPQSFSPGNEQRYFWGSAAADKPGTRNFIGIKNPVVDKIIDKIIFSQNRNELVAATRALDRVLLWNHYVIPQWYLQYDRISYWTKFKHPVSLSVLDPKCIDDCMKKAASKEGRVMTLDPWFLSTWWMEEQPKG